MAVSIKPATQLVDVDHSKAIFFTSYVPVRNAAKVVTPSYNVINYVDDVGGRVGSVVVVVDGAVYLVRDIRHSRSFINDDETVYSTTSTSQVEVLKIDYGSVINAKEILLKVGLWSSSTSWPANAAVYISVDNVTWTQIASWGTYSTSEVIFTTSTGSYSFRYLSFRIWNPGAATTSSRLRKVVIIV
jgi:hypothetical protein